MATCLFKYETHIVGNTTQFLCANGGCAKIPRTTRTGVRKKSYNKNITTTLVNHRVFVLAITIFLIILLSAVEIFRILANIYGHIKKDIRTKLYNKLIMYILLNSGVLNPDNTQRAFQPLSQAMRSLHQHSL